MSNIFGTCFRIVHIHGVKITTIRPPWHVLLYYFTTRDFIKNLFDTFLTKWSEMVKVC